MVRFPVAFTILSPVLALLASATPLGVPIAPLDVLPAIRDSVALSQRQNVAGDPQFPASPSSCGVCAPKYDQMRVCINLAPVLSNFSTIISSPGKFVEVLTCACADPFVETFPDCVDCLKQTGQLSALNMSDPDGVVVGLEKACQFEAALGINSTKSSAVSTVSAVVGSTARISLGTAVAVGLLLLGFF
ncbi:unnamed protein product [Mycena citricolor]|uniref:Uncharacterized protein n=1 Tax=Mycena citricolor TaxID=2018698 RepID=A0AAD2H8N9_9AGAR|nr:unnamed protein product [Mycena citricolor]